MRANKVILAVVVLAIVILYQNCAGGFAAGDALHNASASSMGSNTGTPPSPTIPVASVFALPTPPPLPSGMNSGTKYYVSPNGDDANDGLNPATAWKTVAKVAATTFAPGDTVLFEGGQTFDSCSQFLGSRTNGTLAKPFTIDQYGTGKFTLLANCASGSHGAIEIVAATGFVLRNAIIRGDSGVTRYGVWIYNYKATPSGGVIVRDCDIGGFFATGSLYGSEILLTQSSATLGFIDDIEIVNNVLHGLSGPTSPDDNGITGYAHGGLTHVIIHGNQISNIGTHDGPPPGLNGSGILVQGVTDGVVQLNVVHDIGANENTCGGPAGIWGASAVRVNFQFNESYFVRPLNPQGTAQCDYDGFDLDVGTTDSVMQYNYSHDNAGDGFLAYGLSSTWSNNTYRYNLSENDGAGFVLSLTSGQPFLIHNNVVYSHNSGFQHGAATSPVPFVISNQTPTVGTIANNVFFTDSPSGTFVKTALTPVGLTFTNNAYFSQTGVQNFSWASKNYASVAAWLAGVPTSGDPAAVTDDPGLMAVGSAGTCNGYSAACVAGYKLSKTSPLRGKATRVSTTNAFGTVHDYFGTPIGNHNIGLDESM